MWHGSVRGHDAVVADINVEGLAVMVEANAKLRDR
jgi:hypothetical protein